MDAIAEANMLFASLDNDFELAEEEAGSDVEQEESSIATKKITNYTIKSPSNNGSSDHHWESSLNSAIVATHSGSDVVEHAAEETPTFLQSAADRSSKPTYGGFRMRRKR